MIAIVRTDIVGTLNSIVSLCQRIGESPYQPLIRPKKAISRHIGKMRELVINLEWTDVLITSCQRPLNHWKVQSNVSSWKRFSLYSWVISIFIGQFLFCVPVNTVSFVQISRADEHFHSHPANELKKNVPVRWSINSNANGNVVHINSSFVFSFSLSWSSFSFAL